MIYLIFLIQKLPYVDAHIQISSYLSMKAENVQQNMRFKATNECWDIQIPDCFACWFWKYAPTPKASRAPSPHLPCRQRFSPLSKVYAILEPLA